MPNYLKFVLVVFLVAPFVATLQLYGGLSVYRWCKRRMVNARWYEARLLRKQRRMPKDAKAANRLGKLYMARWWRTTGDDRAANTREALRWLELAMRLETDPHYRRALLLRIMLIACEAQAFDVAKTRARQLLNGGVNQYDMEASDAAHYGNVVLGRIAVRDGTIALAEQHLLKSACIENSPRLSSYGPNMSLARDLLEAGRVETVSDYLRLCHKFWRHDRGAINCWLGQIGRGEIVDFGKQLRR